MSRRSASASSTSTRRRSAGPGRWPAGPAGRSSRWPAPTPPSRSSAPCSGWPACSGADADGIPWVNRLVDAVRDEVGLEHGVALPVWDALRGERADRADRDRAGPEGGGRPGRSPAARGPRRRAGPPGRPPRGRRAGCAGSTARRAERERLVRRIGDAPRKPWIYLIVATGDIYEDIPQAQAAAREGADVIAVIRSTGQSLLDYVPEGATREGYAGTYATQENFRLMRAALDDVSKELGRYVRLTNYASGLCMPEIATLAGLERLDMMLNDSMYGILFRDINPIRTFVDQRFSRQVHARAGIIINTGEDNYLTTADAVDEAHTVTVSQLLNEYFAKEAGLEDWQLGLGHAFEINPDAARLVPARAGARAAGPRAVPGRAAEVDAADQAHDRRRVPRLPARRLLQPGRRADRPGHPAGRHDDRGGGHAVPVRPRPRPAERPLRAGRGRQPARGLPPGARRLHPDPGRTRCSTRRSSCWSAIVAEPGTGPAARGDRRRHLRPDEAPGRPGQGPRRGRAATRPATTTRPPTSWRTTRSTARGGAR